MSDSEQPRPHPGAFVVVTAALLILFAGVSRLGKPDDPSGIQRIVNTHLRADTPAGRTPAPDQFNSDRDDDLTRERKRLLAERGRASHELGSRDIETGVRHTVIVSRIGLPPEAPAPAVRGSSAPRQSGAPTSSWPPAIAPANGYGDVAPGPGQFPVDARGRHFPVAPTGQTSSASAGADPVGVMPRSDIAGANLPRQHVVKNGETLVNIAKQYYGDPLQYTRIMQANPWLGNVPRVEVGKTLVIPPTR